MDLGRRAEGIGRDRPRGSAFVFAPVCPFAALAVVRAAEEFGATSPPCIGLYVCIGDTVNDRTLLCMLGLSDDREYVRAFGCRCLGTPSLGGIH